MAPFLLLVCISITQPLVAMVRNDSVAFATKQLFECATYGEDPAFVKICGDHGGNILATNEQGQTPLQVANYWLNFWEKQLSLPAKQRTLIKRSSDLQRKILHQERTIRALKKLQREEPQEPTQDNTFFDPLLILCSCALSIPTEKDHINTSPNHYALRKSMSDDIYTIKRRRPEWESLVKK